jgi:hypothetical protein
MTVRKYLFERSQRLTLKHRKSILFIVHIAEEYMVLEESWLRVNQI